MSLSFAQAGLKAPSAWASLLAKGDLWCYSLTLWQVRRLPFTGGENEAETSCGQNLIWELLLWL